MMRENIEKRNATNAQKSTGPKTKAGKEIASQNARRHGATGKPEPASVAKWLAIILKDPEHTQSEIDPRDERSQAALRLAASEARLVKCETAFHEYLITPNQDEDWLEEAQSLFRLIKDEWDRDGLSMRTLNLVIRLIDELEAEIPKPGFVHFNRYRLLKRYLREAQTGRSRALRHWIEVNRKINQAA